LEPEAQVDNTSEVFVYFNQVELLQNDDIVKLDVKDSASQPMMVDLLKFRDSSF
jgi:hypothetical protein